jgi:hypothetical protein
MVIKTSPARAIGPNRPAAAGKAAEDLRHRCRRALGIGGHRRSSPAAEVVLTDAAERLRVVWRAAVP